MMATVLVICAIFVTVILIRVLWRKRMGRCKTNALIEEKSISHSVGSSNIVREGLQKYGERKGESIFCPHCETWHKIGNGRVQLKLCCPNCNKIILLRQELEDEYQKSVQSIRDKVYELADRDFK